MLAPQTISAEILLEKYAKSGEQSVDEVRLRVARALAAVESPATRARWEDAFFRAQQDGLILGGRINSAAGTDLKATLINCFVQPVGDSISGDDGGIRHLRRAERGRRDHAPRRRRRLRLLAHPPAGRARARHRQPRKRAGFVHARFRSESARPSSRPARGAARRWAILRCDHPDIEEFIHAKDGGDLTNFNISVAVTDAFMRAVRDDAMWDLVHRRGAGAGR